jgi:hypothetical protein
MPDDMTPPTSRTGYLDSSLKEGRTQVVQANGFLAVAECDSSSDVKRLVQNSEDPAADDKGRRLPRDAAHHRPTSCHHTPLRKIESSCHTRKSVSVFQHYKILNKNS